MQDVAVELPAAKELFNKASDILGYDLLEVCTEGRETQGFSISGHDIALFNFK